MNVIQPKSEGGTIMAFCKQCGTDLQGAKFCPSCGAAAEGEIVLRQGMSGAYPTTQIIRQQTLEELQQLTDHFGSKAELYTELDEVEKKVEAGKNTPFGKLVMIVIGAIFLIITIGIVISGISSGISMAISEDGLVNILLHILIRIVLAAVVPGIIAFLLLSHGIKGFKKNKKQYEKNAFKGMQFAFWQTVIEVGGKYAEFPISAEFLQHSLDDNPKDLYITNGNIVETIKNDNNFQNIVKKIVEEKGKDKDSFEFNSNDYVNHEYDWAFNDKDLYFALHLVELKVSALKENDKWNLDIKIHDTYDYSKAKNLFQYYNDTNSIPKSILSSSLYNLAAFSNYFKVMKIYDIDIEFTINDYQ